MEDNTNTQVYSAGAASSGNSLVLALGGYEGPLDLLLGLARQKRVDLQHISIKNLAEQYLEFIERAKKLHLAIKAEYLVMAVHLARMKARLLLPRDNVEGEEAEKSAEALRENLIWLEGARKIARLLRDSPRLGMQVFSCASVQNSPPTTLVEWEVEANLFELLQSYAKIERRREYKTKQLRIRSLPIYDAEQAKNTLKSQIASQWRDLLSLVPDELLRQTESEEDSKLFIRSVIAGFFVAALDLTNYNMSTKAYAELSQPSFDSPLQIRTLAPKADMQPSMHRVESAKNKSSE